MSVIGWFWSPEQLWCMGQAMYLQRYRTYYANSRLVLLEAPALRRCLTRLPCQNERYGTACPIRWGNQNTCEPVLPDDAALVNVRYLVHRAGQWRPLPFAFGREYIGPVEPTFDQLLSAKSYRGAPESVWAANHGRMAHGGPM